MPEEDAPAGGVNPVDDAQAGGVNPVETPPIGARVELRGLQSKPELNGRCGTVVSWDADKGRAGVKIGNRTLSLKPTNLTTVNEDESATFECAICWADVEGSPAELPCCGAPPPGSSTCYCERCIEIICEQALGGMGRCPTCREFIKVENGRIAVAEGLETCVVCNQARPVAERMRGQPLCGACSMGVRRPLRYECERCHRIGPVPHPMYRYQPTPGEFGNNPWMCQACADFTNRRVVPEDVHKVPPDDCPESWGRREEWLAQVREQNVREREQRRRERHGEVEGADPNARGARLARFLDGPWLLVALFAVIWMYRGV